MAFQTQRADVRQIAFAAALDDGHDMIRVPECAAGIGLDAPLRPGPSARGAAKLLQVMKSCPAIRAAGGAQAVVALEHLFAKVAGIAA